MILSEVKLADNFTAEEMRWEPSQPENVKRNLEALAVLAQRFREAGGNLPMVVTSTYRDYGRNLLAGGASGSQHLTGSAMDFRVSNPEQWVSRVIAVMPPSSFGQIIFYGASSQHVHLSLPNRSSGRTGEVLREVSPGKYVKWSGGGAVPAADTESREGVASVATLLLIILAAVLLLGVL